MGTITRGIKNAFRNSIRATSITFILAISIAMSLIMLMSLSAVDKKIDKIKSSVGNTLTVSPAGVRGFEGGGELLTNDDVSKITAISGIKSVYANLTDRLTTDTNTNLKSAIEPGSFGERRRDEQNRTNDIPQNPNRPMPQNFSLPVQVTGTNDLSNLTALNVSKFEVTEGQKFANTETGIVALVGKDLATKNNLSIDSTFTAYSQEIKVIGIFDTGNNFTNGNIIMPLSLLQTISDQTNQVNNIIIETTSIDTVESVDSAIKSTLGEDKIDVVNQLETAKTATEPLQNIRTISIYSLIGALIAGAIIILFTMMMIARERRREIGVLKAIGASNTLIVSQFGVEAIVLTFLSSVIGIILGVILGNPVLKALVQNASSSPNPIGIGDGSPNGLGGGMGRMMMERVGQNLNLPTVIDDLTAVVEPKIIVYGLLIALAIAILGSIIPAFVIAKIRPAETMRTE